jgi:hypothetical protein
MSQIATLASGIYITEFDSDSTAANFTQISGWLSENLGLLNTLINTNFSGQNPNFGLEEQSIYKEVYLYNYYNKQSRNILRGITATSNAGDNILSVSDGDNQITFVNRNEVGKVYRDLAKESKQKLDSLVAKYNIYASKPLQVGGIENEYSVPITSEDGGTLDGGVQDEFQPPSDGIFDAGEDV